MLQRGGLSRVAISFAATLVVLSLGAAALYIYAGRVPVEHLPLDIPAYGGVLRQFVPMDALQVSFNNLSAIRAINSSVVRNAEFLNIIDPPVVVNTTALTSRLTIGFAEPNASVNVGFLTADSFGVVASAFNTTKQPSKNVGEFRLYNVAEFNKTRLSAYWVTLIESSRAVAFSQGALPALEALSKVIGVVNGSSDSILARLDVRQTFYIVNGTRGHLAIGIQEFIGVVRSGTATFITVDSAGPSLEISYVVQFSSPEVALAEVNTVRSDYISARQFVVYDQFVKAVETKPKSDLRVAVALVG